MDNPPNEGKRPPEDRLLQLLSNRRRRDVVEYLRDEAVPVAVSELSEHVVDRELERSVMDTPELEESVRISLYHCHLPKLEDAGIVAHDRDRNAVEPADQFERALDVGSGVLTVGDA